ncbi:adenylyl-sulfate kinase [Magnetofaba australis]|uniref:Adenylyl-sulfate kinase n=1 Tax=Magnetofaba australis IT-1 TaxID=1434232 RepID=A0A1Y2K3T0_9PROT|nr:adenylyl-sulfate kinase [Magnetofaba australis]OSM01685.1 putative adenylylsulfate kinase [Magnetofaba australis IT-1]
MSDPTIYRQITPQAAKGHRAVRATNLYGVDHRVDAPAREAINGHKGGILWLTGLSGSGKSTLAMGLEAALFARGVQTYVLDGDNVRAGLNKDLGFSPADRAENIRRIGEVANLFADAGLVVITAFISPYRSDRDMVRAMHADRFNEVYIAATLDECESRDPKGLYKRARAGEIPEFTGISAPYEAPEKPELLVDTTGRAVAACVEELADYAMQRFVTGAGDQ